MRKILTALFLLISSSAWAQTSVPTAAPTQVFGREDPVHRMQGANALQDQRKQFNSCLMGDAACGESITPSLGAGTKIGGNLFSSAGFGATLDLSSLLSGDCTITSLGHVTCPGIGAALDLSSPPAIGSSTPNTIKGTSIEATTSIKDDGLTTAGCLQTDANGNLTSSGAPCPPLGVFSVDQGNRDGILGGQPTVWASHQSLGFSATTNGTTTVVTASGHGGLTVGNGLMIPGAGPTAAFATQSGTFTATHVGGGSGSHTYKWAMVVADPLHGMAATPIASNTLSSMPAISALGTADYFTFSAPASSGATVPLYILYCSYDSGSYTFVGVDTSPNFAGSPDIGQRPAGGRGWPATLTGGTSFAGQKEDFYTYINSVTNTTHIVVNDTPSTNVTGATALPDDSLAAWLTGQLAIAAGGGVVQFGPHTYRASRPMFWGGSAWSTTLASVVGATTPAIVPLASNITVAGSSVGATTIITGPDEYIFGALLDFGEEYSRPWSNTYYAINTVNQGDTAITLTSAGDAAHFTVGSDLWLFSGSFQSSTCPASGGTPGTNCHFSESNSITAIDSTNGILYLKYPANKQYYADGAGNPFGAVPMAVGVNDIHNVSIHDLTIDTYSIVGLAAFAFDLSIYRVSTPWGANGGLFWGSGGGRAWNISDLHALIGDGGASFHVEWEIDFVSDLRLLDSTLSFNSTTNGDGTYLLPGISLTEGGCGYLFRGDTFTNAGINTEAWINSINVSLNEFRNADLAIGSGTGTNALASFGTPNNWIVDGNVFNGSAYAAAGGATHGAALSTLATVANGTAITGNTIYLRPTDTTLYCIAASAGVITGNHCYTNHTGSGQGGIDILPQVASGVPLAPINLTGNISYGNAGAGIRIDDPGSSWGGFINLTGNTAVMTTGTGDAVVSISHTPNVRVLNEQISTGGAIYTPASLSNLVAQYGSAIISDTSGNLTNACKGDVTLSTGSGTFSNACVTSASACNAKDITTPANPCTLAAPGTGSIAVTGTSSDHCRVWCE